MLGAAACSGTLSEQSFRGDGEFVRRKMRAIAAAEQAAEAHDDRGWQGRAKSLASGMYATQRVPKYLCIFWSQCARLRYTHTHTHMRLGASSQRQASGNRDRCLLRRCGCQ